MDNIKEIIDRFFNGATSIEEEYELRRRLCEEQLPADVAHEKELLLAMLPTPCEVPQGMESRLNNLIDTLAANKEAKAMPHPMKKSSKARRIIICTLATAAAIALTFALYPERQRPKDTFTSPEEAAIYINETFNHLSMVVNSSRNNCINAAAHLQNVGTTARNCITVTGFSK